MIPTMRSVLVPCLLGVLGASACGEGTNGPGEPIDDTDQTADTTVADTHAPDIAETLAEVASDAIASDSHDDAIEPSDIPPVEILEDSEAPDTEDAELGDDVDAALEDLVADISEPDLLEPDTRVPDTLAPDTLAPDTIAPDTVAPDTVTPEVTEPPDPCAAEPPTPLQFQTLQGFTGSEDFAFREQWAYSVDQNGNLVRDTASGSGQMVLPNLSTFAAGMALLPDGRLAVNDAEQGALVLVSVASTPVSKVTLLGGLSYPNGIDVDADGFVYIAEQDAGRVRRIDTTDGSFQIIATDLFNPNGVSFAPGYRRLYIGSFGGGVVYAIDRRDDGTWTAPVVWLALPGFGAIGPAIDSCKGGQPGDLCYTNDGLGGHCSSATVDGMLVCELSPDGIDPLVEICSRLDVGERCSIKIAGVRYAGSCVDDPFSVDLVCDIAQNIVQPCFHGYPGKACVSFENGPPFFGVCTDAANIPPFWGYPPQGLFCIPPGSGDGGGLDGLNVDACGTVYVTEYILGRVWRKRTGGPVELAATLPSQWIPNMHWGSGVGGWSTTTLYVADRDLGRMFGLVIGREGKHTVPAP